MGFVSGGRADLLNPFRIRHEWGKPITGCHLRFNPVLRYSIPLGFQDMIPASSISNLLSAVCYSLLATCYLLLE